MAVGQDRKINVQGFLDSLSGRRGGVEEDLLAKRRQSIAADVSTAAAKSPTPFKTSLATLMGDTLGKGLLRAFNVEDEERQRAIDIDQANKLIAELSRNPNSTNLFKIGEIKAAMNDSAGAAEAFGLANQTKNQEANRITETEFASKLSQLDPTAKGAKEEALKLLNQANLSDSTRVFAPQIVNLISKIDDLNKPSAEQSKRASQIEDVKTRGRNAYGIEVPDDVASRIVSQGIGTVVTADGQIINRLDALLGQFVQSLNSGQSTAPNVSSVISTPVFEQKQKGLQIEKARQETEKREKIEREKLQDQDRTIATVMSGSAVQESIPTLTAIQEISNLMANKDIGNIKRDPETLDFVYDENVDLENFSPIERTYNAGLRAVGLGQEQNPIYLAYLGLKNKMLKERSGAAVTTSEMERLEKEIIGDDITGIKEETLIKFVNALRKEQENKWGSVMGQMNVETQKRFLERNNLYYATDPVTGKLMRESFPGSGRYVTVTEKTN